MTNEQFIHDLTILYLSKKSEIKDITQMIDEYNKVKSEIKQIINSNSEKIKPAIISRSELGF